MDHSLIDLLGPEIEQNPTSDSIPAILTEAELASLLGLSTNRVRALATEGVLSRVSRGRYDSRSCVLAYTERLRASAERAGRPSIDGDDLKAAKLALTIEQREKLALANAEARRELIPAADVKEEWLGVMIDLRASIMGIPARVASRCGLDRSAAAELEAQVRAALEGIADERSI